MTLVPGGWGTVVARQNPGTKEGVNVSPRELICLYEIIKKVLLFKFPSLRPVKYSVRIDGMHWKTVKFGEKKYCDQSSGIANPKTLGTRLCLFLVLLGCHSRLRKNGDCMRHFLDLNLEVFFNHVVNLEEKSCKCFVMHNKKLLCWEPA